MKHKIEVYNDNTLEKRIFETMEEIKAISEQSIVIEGRQLYEVLAVAKLIIQGVPNSTMNLMFDNTFGDYTRAIIDIIDGAIIID